MCYYISGFIAKKLMQSIDCLYCEASLYDNSSTSVGYDYLSSKSPYRSVHQDWKIYVRYPADIMYKSSTMKGYRKLHTTDSIVVFYCLF